MVIDAKVPLMNSATKTPCVHCPKDAPRSRCCSIITLPHLCPKMIRHFGRRSACGPDDSSSSRGARATKRYAIPGRDQQVRAKCGPMTGSVANFDVQLHIRESISSNISVARWIPGSLVSLAPRNDAGSELTLVAMTRLCKALQAPSPPPERKRRRAGHRIEPAVDAGGRLSKACPN
jgi:hypothetical protein